MQESLHILSIWRWKWNSLAKLVTSRKNLGERSPPPLKKKVYLSLFQAQKRVGGNKIMAPHNLNFDARWMLGSTSCSCRFTLRKTIVPIELGGLPVRSGMLRSSCHDPASNSGTLSLWSGHYMDFQEVGCGDMDWIDLAQDRDRWQALVNTVM